MQDILITGGTGLIGKSLIKHLLKKGYGITVLTRSLKGGIKEENISYALWDIKKGTLDREAVTNADAIIHLAGAGVMDKRWTLAYKKEILESRTKSSDLLIKTLKENPHNVKVIVSASAMGWYGPDKKPGHLFEETDPPDQSFLGEVCRQWEESTAPAEEMGIRVCRLRTGIVLSGEGGAYLEFRSPMRLGVAPVLGTGKQVISWIHINDLCRAYIYALGNESIRGSYNAVSPGAVSNKKLTLTIADKVKGNFYLPIHIPKFIIKLAFGQRSIELLISTSVSAEKIKSAGFIFDYPDIESAVNAIESNVTDQLL